MLAKDQMVMYKQLLTLFITKEIFHFGDLRDGLASEFAKIDGLDEAEQQLMLETMHQRVTQHNMQAVAGYYSRISLERLSTLLALDVEKMETELCEMVTTKKVYARIDRPGGVITFAPPKAPNELLNDWSNDISSLLTLLEE